MRVSAFARPSIIGAFLAFGMSGAACSKVLGVDFDAPRLASDVLGDGGYGTDCVPKSCEAQSFSCGTQNDGCGGILECGSCAPGSPCVEGQCRCQPKTCPELGAACGIVDNGCGATLDCGGCGNASEACVANQCECQPKNCTARGANCGTVPDGCGNTYVCGDCASNADGPNCGGGGANRCGPAPCTPLSCAGHCGDMSDGCGAIVSCGGCSAPQTCGGGGSPNVCGCTPTTCAQQGKNCGVVADGCGGTLDCGACGSPNSCGGGGVPNVCGCTPTATSCFPGQNCGTISNGCGANIGCGTCSAPNTCGGAGTPNVCGCRPVGCGDFGCGTHPNGCGGTINCGICPTCFVGETRVAMADGTEKEMAKIVPGDRVRSIDRRTGEVGATTVRERKEHEAAGSLAGIVVLDGTLHATRNHPIFVNDRVVTMEDVREGDVVTVSDGKGGTMVKRIASVGLERGGAMTYDLDLAESDASYFADGIVVQQKQMP